MRIGFVGFSTPLYYDYSGGGHRHRMPNPILDSPFGLMLLYDELWFVTRALCPENLRNAQFVRMLDEENALPDLEGLNWQELRRTHEAEFERLLSAATAASVAYDQPLQAMRVDWEVKPDNHGRGAELGDLRAMGNAGTLDNIILDSAIIDRLDVPGLELVGNTFGQRYLEAMNPSVREADLAHVLVVDDIPNWLTPEGPHHPAIDEVRSDSYLQRFRTWVSETAATSPAEALAIKRDVETRLREAQEEIFLQYLDPQKKFVSIGKTAMATGASILVPFSGTASSVIQELRQDRRVESQRYQGFLVGHRRAIRMALRK